MLEVTLSEQYQIAIPQEIIDSLKLQVGQEFIIRVQDNSILLIPKKLDNKGLKPLARSQIM